MKRAYTEPLKISNARKQDLLSLVQSQLIPDQYHEFYEKISSKNKQGTEPKSIYSKVNKLLSKNDFYHNHQFLVTTLRYYCTHSSNHYVTLHKIYTLKKYSSLNIN